MRPYRFEIIPGSERGDLLKGRSDWYWRLKAGNGRTVADGAEGYSTWIKCHAAIVKLCNAMESGRVIVPKK